MKTFLVALVLFLQSPSVFAGNERGNGGDVVSCETSTELLDFYEGREIRGWIPNLGGTGTYVERARFAIRRLAHVDPALAEEYLLRLDEIQTDILFLPNVDLVDIPDSEHSIIPKGCKIEQIMIRRKDVLPGEPHFVGNKDLWNKLDDDNKAGLLVHEIINEHFSGTIDFPFEGRRRHLRLTIHEQQDSRKARYFTSALTSPIAENWSFREYIVNVRQLDVLTLIYLNDVPTQGLFEFYPSGALAGYKVWDSFTFQTSAGPIFLQNSLISLYENGDIKGIARIGSQTIDLDGKKIPITGDGDRCAIEFAPDGYVSAAYFGYRWMYSLKQYYDYGIGGMGEAVIFQGNVKFHPNGKIRESNLILVSPNDGRPIQIQIRNGQYVTVPIPSVAHFDTDGYYLP